MHLVNSSNANRKIGIRNMISIPNHLHWLLLAIFMFSSCSMPKMMFPEDQSKYEFSRTVEEVKLSLENNGWEVIEKVDMKEHYAKFGLETRDIVTFEICKPEGAVKILNEDKYTRMVPFMPMRVAVYKKSNGKTYISRLRLNMMSKMNPGTVKKVMKEGAIDLEKAIQGLIQ